MTQIGAESLPVEMQVKSGQARGDVGITVEVVVLLLIAMAEALVVDIDRLHLAGDEIVAQVGIKMMQGKMQ